jgi:hypothetical protein
MIENKYQVCEAYLVRELGIDTGRMRGSTINHAVRAGICEAFEKAVLRSHFAWHNGGLWVFNGRFWAAGDIDNFAVVVSNVMHRRDFPALYRVGCRDAIVKHVIGLLRTRKLEVELNLVAFQNCVYDLRSGETTLHSPVLGATRYLDFDYRRDAKCPDWIQYLSEAVGSEAQIRTLQEFLGARLYGLTDVLVLLGNSGIVSGVLWELFSDTLGIAALSKVARGIDNGWVVEVSSPEGWSRSDFMREKAGIFNWIAEGYRAVVKNGGKLTFSAENERFLNGVRVGSDSRLTWLKSTDFAPLRVNGERRAELISDLYRKYVGFCRENNMNSFGQGEFSRFLTQEGFEKTRRRYGMAVWIYTGGKEPDKEKKKIEEAVDALPF